jgi:hypothetical protein
MWSVFGLSMCFELTRDIVYLYATDRKGRGHMDHMVSVWFEYVLRKAHETRAVPLQPRLCRCGCTEHAQTVVGVGAQSMPMLL